MVDIDTQMITIVGIYKGIVNYTTDNIYYLYLSI